VSSISIPHRVARAAAVFCGRHGDVTRLAQGRGVFRQTLSREARAVARALDRDHANAARADLRQRLAQAQAELACLKRWGRHATVVDLDKQAEFASTAQALGVSLSAARALLTVLVGKAAPSVARLGRLSQQAGRRASAAPAVLGEYARAGAKQVAADEIFVGKKPVLMALEQHSLCWLGGRLAPSRDGPEWAKEFEQLPALAQVTATGARAWRRG
jgi:hypothetical protein